MTSQVTAVPDLSLGAGKEHVKRGGGGLVLVVCVRASGGNVYGWGVLVCVCDYVCVRVCISSHIFASSLCEHAHRGSVYTEIGGLPKQRVSYSQGP